MDQWEHRTIQPLPASHAELGRWLWALEDTRARTISAIEGMTQEELDWTAPSIGNAVGSLLYHIALIETDYLCVDILGMVEDGYFPDLEELLPFPDRDEHGKLIQVSGVTLSEHLSRLETVRKRFLEIVSALDADQLAATRRLPEWKYDISPAWTLHHLMQHEAEHRGQIMSIRSLYNALA